MERPAEWCVLGWKKKRNLTQGLHMAGQHFRKGKRIEEIKTLKRCNNHQNTHTHTHTHTHTAVFPWSDCTVWHNTATVYLYEYIQQDIILLLNFGVQSVISRFHSHYSCCFSSPKCSNISGPTVLVDVCWFSKLINCILSVFPQQDQNGGEEWKKKNIFKEEKSTIKGGKKKRKKVTKSDYIYPLPHQKSLHTNVRF